MLNLPSVRQEGRESVSLHSFQNRNTLIMNHFQNYGVEDESKIADDGEREAQYDESRRVVYVATTRAKRILMFFSDTADFRNRPTPFLKEMGL